MMQQAFLLVDVIIFSSSYVLYCALGQGRFIDDEKQLDRQGLHRLPN